jgi:phosphatidylinositol alpha-1,6-mannosyltransferase
VEGFGIVFLEAAACGKPVVGGRSGGAREAVRDGVTGLLVSPGDDDAAVDAVVRLLADETLRRRLGDGGRRLVAGRCTWDRAARRVRRVTGALAWR